MSDNVLIMEPGPTRLESKGTKIGCEKTGFNGSIFLHVDYDPATNKIWGIRLSEKSKDGSTLDGLLREIGDAATASIRQIQSIDGAR
jgi:hypothetical protein